MPKMVEILPGGRMKLNLHPGQMRAWNSTKRTVCVLAGTQAGKTEQGPHWLYREIQRCGPGDYLVVAPSFPLLQLKVLPALTRLFERVLRVGEYVGNPAKVFRFSREGMVRTFRNVPNIEMEEVNIYFGHAQDPDSLESMTAKAAWLDEAGQVKFRIGSYEAVMRRLAVSQGRMLITTTPYAHTWLKRLIYDPWKACEDAGISHPDIDVIRFESRENPSFPEEEWERAKAILPEWKFNMFYRAMFTRPAGQIYEVFSEREHVEPPLVRNSERDAGKSSCYLGLDFGAVNTAAVFVVETPDGVLHVVDEYHAGGKTAAEHTRILQSAAPAPIELCVGGAKSEGQWRAEFTAAGLYVAQPSISSVEVGIDRVIACLRSGELKISRRCERLIEQLMTYSRETDEAGDVSDRIAEKEEFHLCDALRYIVSHLRRPGGSSFSTGESSVRDAALTERLPADIFASTGQWDGDMPSMKVEDQW